MANDLDLAPPSLDAVLAYGDQSGASPEAQARAVWKWRNDTRSYGEQKLAEDDPVKLFKGNAALDRDVQGALDGLKQKLGPNAPDNPLFHAPQSSEDFHPLIAASGKQVGSFQAQPGVGGDMDVLVHVTNPKGDDPAPTLIKAPMVTDQAVQKARDAAQEELDNTIEESRGTDSSTALMSAIGFEPSGVSQNLKDKQRDLELRVQQLSGPQAKGILQGEAITNAFQATPTGKKFEEWHPGEDLAKGFLRFSLGGQYALQQATGDQSDLTGLSEGPVTADTTRQAIGALDEAIPGTSTTNPAMKVVKGATETLGSMPMVLNPGGSAVMALSAYGNSVADAQIGAEAADKQAEQLKKVNPDLSKKFSDLATQMRNDAQAEGALRGTTMGALLELMPQAKSLPGNIARESATWGGIAASNDQFNQRFKGTQPDPMSVLDGIVAGAALGTARGLLSRGSNPQTSQQAYQAAQQAGWQQQPNGTWTRTTASGSSTYRGQGAPPVPPGPTQGGPPPADDWTSATAGTGPQPPPPAGAQATPPPQGAPPQPQARQAQQRASTPPPEPAKAAPPPPRQPAKPFNTQAEFNVFMDQAVKSGDVEAATEAVKVNSDAWQKQWLKSRLKQGDDYQQFINSIYGGRTNAEHAAYVQAQRTASAASGGTAPGSAGRSRAAGPAPEARPASATPEPEPVTPSSNESVPGQTRPSGGTPSESPIPAASPDAGVPDENNAPRPAEVPAPQAGSGGGIEKPTLSRREAPEGVTFVDDVNKALSRKLSIEGKPYLVQITPDGSIGFTAAGSIAKSRQGAFKVMNRLTPEILELAKELDAQNPGMTFKWSTSTPERNTLFNRYLSRFGITPNERNEFTLTHKPNATPQRQEPKSDLAEHPRDDQGGTPAQRSGSSGDEGGGQVQARAQPAASDQAPEAQNEIITASAVKDGERIMAGRSPTDPHDSVEARNKIPPGEAIRGFLTSEGRFVNRAEAAKIAQVPTKEEPGQLHTQDIAAALSESPESKSGSETQGAGGQTASAAPSKEIAPVKKPARKKPFSIRKKKGAEQPAEAPATQPGPTEPEPPPEAPEPAPAPKPASPGATPHELQEPQDKFLKHPVIGPTYAAKTQRAVDEGRPVNAAMAAATGVKLPDGYQVGADGIARPRPTEAVIREVLNLGDPVAASDLDRYGIPVPHDYYVGPDGVARHGNDWTEATDGSVGGGDAGNPPPPTSGSEQEPFYSGLPIPAPKLRRMNSLDRATTGWSFKLQKSFQEARRAQAAIEKVAKTEPQRAAMSLYVEAGGDMAKLGRWATAQPRPQVIAAGGKKFQKVLDAFRKAAKDAMSLNPEQIAVAQKIRQTFDVLHTRGTRAGIINAFRDNYIPHIWNLDGGPGGGASGRRLQKNFRFAKARTFDTTFDGVMEGMMPKTMDISKTLPAYMHEMNSVIADRQFVQDLDGKWADDGRPLIVPRGNVKQIQGDQSDKAYMIAPRKWGEDAVDKNGNKFDQRDYKIMEDQPALTQWLFKGTDENGNPMFLNSELAVHPDTYRRITAMMGNSKIRRWYNSPSSTWASPIPKALVKFYDKTQSVMKREMFSFYAPFHQVQEGTHAIGHTVNPFSGLLPVDLRQPGPADAARHGLMLMPDRASMHQYLEGVGSGQTWLSRGLKALHIPGLDNTHALAWLGRGAEAYQDYLFHSYIPRLKYTTYEHVLARARKQFADMIAKGEATEDDIKMLSAHYVNSAFGHLNYALMDRSPTIQHFLQMGLLSPDFTEGRVRFAGQAVKGANGRNPVGSEQLRAMAILAAVMAGGAYTLAHVFDGKWDYKDPFSVTFGNRTFSMRSVPEDIWRFIRDTKNQLPTWLGGNSRRTGNEFVTARINPTLQTMQQAIEGTNFRGEKVKIQDTAAEALGKFLPITLRQVPGLRNLTDSSHSSPVPPLQQFIGSLGIKASRFSPITGAYELANEWKDKNGVPSDYKGTYPVSQYQQLRYAIEDGDIPKAAEAYKELLNKEKPDKLAKGFAASVNHPFTGSKANDAKFARSLTGEDKAVYDAAVDRRKMILNTFPKVREEANKKQP